MNALLLLNPNAGRARKIGLLRLLSFLEAVNIHATVVSTDDPGDAHFAVAAALSASPPAYDCIIAAGGDGTIHSVLPAFAERAQSGAASAVPLAVLPVGSVNVLARELRLPLSLPDAARVIAHGARKPVDLGLFNDRPFLLMAGIGFDAAVVGAINTRTKAKFGVIEYVARGLRAMLSQPAHPFTITCEEMTLDIRSWQLIVANALNYTYGWTFAPHARIDDGCLDLCILPDRGRLARLRQILAILRRKPRAAGMTCVTGAEFTISSPSPVSIQLDGDPAPAITAARVSVLPKALQIIIGEK
jgi:YegS/Rv2252/BmrU family lipid kinase